MPVITFASTKGGVGKTTQALAVGSELASRGIRVAVFDCDPRQDSWRFVRDLGIPEMTAETDLRDDTILPRLRQRRTDSDLIIIDLPGLPSMVMSYAMSRSDLVIIPTRASELDVSALEKTLRLVASTADANERDIQARVLFNAIPSLPTRTLAHVEATVAGLGAQAFRTRILARTAFEQMTFAGKPVRGLGADKALLNLNSLIEEILTLIQMEVAHV